MGTTSKASAYRIIVTALIAIALGSSTTAYGRQNLTGPCTVTASCTQTTCCITTDCRFTTTVNCWSKVARKEQFQTN